MDDDTPGVASVWKTIDKELGRRRVSWAELGRAVGATDQAMNNWKRRQVPPSRYADVATFLGWSVEQLMGHAPEPAATMPPAAATEPVYTKRANDIAKMFDELKDPAVRQAAYAGVQAILQMAKAGQRLPPAEVKPVAPPPAPTPKPSPKPSSPRIEPPPKPKPHRRR